ncbi:MAG TPA: hypothetical protein VGQ31_13855 [Candidatus Limnocylindrales bacterium]|nr:hypothetical protein [Candidatus Limnocylindrales bacterium]
MRDWSVNAAGLVQEPACASLSTQHQRSALVGVGLVGSPGWTGIAMVVMAVPPNVKAASGRSARTLPDQSTSAIVIASRAAGRPVPDSRSTCFHVTFCSGIPASTVVASSSCQVCGAVARWIGMVERGMSIGSVSR